MRGGGAAAAHQFVGDKVVGVVRVGVELGGTVRLLQPALALVVGGLEPRPIRLDLVGEGGQLALLAAGGSARGAGRGLGEPMPQTAIRQRRLPPGAHLLAVACVLHGAVDGLLVQRHGDG